MGDILHPQYNFFHLFIFVWATGAQSHLYNPFIRSFGQQNHIALGFQRQKWCWVCLRGNNKNLCHRISTQINWVQIFDKDHIFDIITTTSITSKALSLSSTVIVFRSSALVSKSNWKSSDIFEDYCDNHHQYRRKDYHIGDCVFRLTFWKIFCLGKEQSEFCLFSHPDQEGSQSHLTKYGKYHLIILTLVGFDLFK